ncbi:hypothetical protein BHM03_00020377 [Ensete ventricosum]|nr:hypothetical protein BHM03_00020377 [Ensete ventricosum]
MLVILGWFTFYFLYHSLVLQAETSEDLYEWKAALENALSQAPSAALPLGQNGIFHNDKTESTEASGDQCISPQLMLILDHLRDIQPVKSTVVGSPILLALEDIDGSPSFLEKALRFIEQHGKHLFLVLFIVVVPLCVPLGTGVPYHTELSSDVSTDWLRINGSRTGRESRVDSLRAAIYETFPEPNRHLVQSSFDHDELISVIQEDLLHEGSMSSELYSDSGDGDVEDDDSTDNDMLDDDECHDEHNGSDDSTDNDIPDDDGYHDEHNGVEADIDDDSEHSSSETIGESNSNVGSNPCDDKVPIPILSQILLSNHCVTRYLSHQVTWLVYPVINSWLSIVYPDQGFSYRSVPPVPGGTYQSFRLPVRGPPATRRYHQNRPLMVDFGHRQSIEGEIDRRRSIEGEKGKKKKKRKRRRGEEE